jgi:polysaccharide biosynthesis/export protein
MIKIKQSFKIFIVCLFYFSALGCFAEKKKLPPTEVMPPVASMALPKDLGVAEKYKINPFDVLDITVYQEPDLSKTVRVSEDGYISFPLIGKVAVAGLDVIAAEEKIAALLEKDYLKNPSVNVMVKEYNIKKVFVMGAVKTPGSYEIPQNKTLTVIEAIAMAGGFTSVAAENSTKIIRTEDGKEQYIEVKVSDITGKGDKSQDLFLKPNDILYVPERVF